MIAIRRALLFAIFGLPATVLLVCGVFIIFPVMNVLAILFDGRPDFSLGEALEPGFEIFSSCWNIRP